MTNDGTVVKLGLGPPARHSRPEEDRQLSIKRGEGLQLFVRTISLEV